MSQYVDSPTKSFTAGAAISQHARVSLASGVLAAAGVNTPSIGTLCDASFASGDVRSVRLANANGTAKMIASEAITSGNPVYAAASGKVAADGFIYEGIALEAATTDGDVIEVFRQPLMGGTQESVTAVAALGSAQGDAAPLTGQVNVVSAGDDTKGVVLPTAVIGTRVEVLNSGSAGLKIYPATSDKINNGSANAAITILENTHATFVATAVDNWAAQYTVNS